MNQLRNIFFHAALIAGVFIFLRPANPFWDGASKEEGPLAQSVRASDS